MPHYGHGTNNRMSGSHHRNDGCQPTGIDSQPRSLKEEMRANKKLLKEEMLAKLETN
jgi:hypothetical protein